MNLSKPYPHYCATHALYYGSPTDTIPATMCPLCGIAKELRSQPAPRTYEVARALSVLDDFERAPQPATQPVALSGGAMTAEDAKVFMANWRKAHPFSEQSINTERMLEIADELERAGHYTMATSVRRITAQRDSLFASPPVQEAARDSVSITPIEWQALWDALAFTAQHAGLVSDAHNRVVDKVEAIIAGAEPASLGAADVKALARELAESIDFTDDRAQARVVFEKILPAALLKHQPIKATAEGWRPIETAPCNEEILGYWPNGEIHPGTISNGKWHRRMDLTPFVMPSLWAHLPQMPLPAAPEQGELKNHGDKK